jgi:integrase
VAERALGARLAEVENNRWQKSARITFESFADRFRREVMPARNLKPSTTIDYEATLRLHLTPFFGELKLCAIDARELDSYIASKTGTLSPKTLGNHLPSSTPCFKVAKRWRLMAGNPVEDVDRPHADSPEMSVLTETEVARLLTAYRELESAPPEDTETADWRQARRIVTVALGTGELLALRWKDVQLLEGVITVREAFVRGNVVTPKSKRSRRTFQLGTVTLDAFNEQWKDTAYTGTRILSSAVGNSEHHSTCPSWRGST